MWSIVSTVSKPARRRSNYTTILRNGGRQRTIATIQNYWYVDPITGHITRTNTTTPPNTTTTTTTTTISPSYQVIVGLEIHVQLNHCPTKLFSAGKQSSSFMSPNTVPAIHPYDIGVPGILPILSISAVRYAILMAGILHCTSIHTISRFERKHYTYSDLPHSYQITQQRWPIATHGFVQCEYRYRQPNHSHNKSNNKSNNKTSSTTAKMIQCRINRIQLEQDTAKTTSITKKTKIRSPITPDQHEAGDEAEEQEWMVTYSRMDMNRAGIPLCEIVTEPDLRSATEASTLVEHVRRTIQYTNISSALLQHGQFRVDCNINIVPIVTSTINPDEDKNSMNDMDGNRMMSQPRKHPRVEVKNLNSIQQIEDCIQFEAYRQLQVLEERHEPSNDNLLPLKEETRTYNALTKRTELLRYKDQQNDYRFLPEMDLPPCVINRTVLQDCDTIQEYIEKYTPTLPEVIQHQLVQHLGIPSELAHVMVTNHPTAVQYFRRALLFALSDVLEDTSNTNRSRDPALIATDVVALGKDDDDPYPQIRSLEDIVLQYTPKSHVRNAAGEVANLLCNVIFHIVKEDNRSRLLQQQQQQHMDSSLLGDDGNDVAMGEITMDQCPITARQLGEIVQMILSEQISYTMAKQLIQILSSSEYNTTTARKEATHVSPREVAQAQNIQLITDADTLRQLCTTEMLKYPNEVQVYQKGGKFIMKMEKLFIGKVMSATRGNAHPERLRDIVVECLSSSTTANATNAFISEHNNKGNNGNFQ